MAKSATEVLRIESLAPTDGSAWDSFVSEAAGATFCHLAGWREVMGAALGCEPIYKVAVAPDGSWAGVLPLVRVRSRLFGHFLVSMPFLNYGGPLGSTAARERLAGWAAEEARSTGADLLELRCREHDDEIDPLTTSNRKITVLLPLPDSSKTLFEKGFSSKLRSQIRRPQKEGMEVRFGLDQMEPFYQVFARNMRDLGTPVLPKVLFESIVRIFRDEAVFGVVYHENTPVAAGAGFLWRDEFEMTWASSLKEYNRLSPNMLLYWGFMEEMIRRQAATFNFGRCTPGGGTHKFKLQWGGKDVALPWLQWSGAEVSATPSPDKPAYQLAISAWQRLPMPVANRIGPFLARRIP